MFLNDLGLNWNNRNELLLRKKKILESGPFRLAHLKSKEYTGYGYIDQETYDSYFKFSFVRNPYRRAFSMYTYLGYSRIISFSSFTKKVLPKKILNNHFFFQPQYDYLYNDKGRLLVDFVGKLENIKEDIKIVLERAAIKNNKLPHVNKSHGGLKRGINKLILNPLLISSLDLNNEEFCVYEKALTDEAKESLHRVYLKDFEFLNYAK
jgi:hypothetical protein